MYHIVNMLPIYVLPKYNIRPSNIVLSQWINITMRSCTSSSSSSSDSDSNSDSDSDNEKAKPKQIKSKNHATSNDKENLKNFLDNMIKQEITSTESKNSLSNYNYSKQMDQKTAEPIKETTNLMEYVNNMIMAKKMEKTIEVAMPKKKSKNTTNKNEHLPYEKRLTRAAENVADTLGGDKTKTTSDLLQKVLAHRVNTLKKEQLTNTKLQTQEKIKQLSGQKEQKNFETKSYSKQKSIIHNLLKEYNSQPVVEKKVVENSISKQLLNLKTVKTKSIQKNNIKSSGFRNKMNVDLWNGKPSDIFNNMETILPNTIPELKTWTALQEKELKMLTLHSPANIFQEMILWTEQGKLWKFPIDNEQGMEEEHNVHFSEHVFMERHLKEWCPNIGPIRHFMELVCNGLSKNPYMTVQEKIDTIMWYKEYFKSKQELLQEVGAIQEPFPDKIKEIQE